MPPSPLRVTRSGDIEKKANGEVRFENIINRVLGSTAKNGKEVLRKGISTN